MTGRPLRTSCVFIGAGAVVLAVLTAPGAGAAPPAGAALGAPGSLSRFDLARKDCVGTARNRTSKVWFTVADGVLSDVYEPTIDNTDVQSLQYVVTDGKTFTDLQERDTTYTVRADRTGMACTVTSTSAEHGYQLVTTFVTDPARDSVVMHTSLRQPKHGKPLSVFARLDAHVNGNGGGGSVNGGGDDGTIGRSGVPGIGDPHTVTQAANPDYGQPTYKAPEGTSPPGASGGYAAPAARR